MGDHVHHAKNRKDELSLKRHFGLCLLHEILGFEHVTAQLSHLVVACVKVLQKVNLPLVLLDGSLVLLPFCLQCLNARFVAFTVLLVLKLHFVELMLHGYALRVEIVALLVREVLPLVLLLSYQTVALSEALVKDSDERLEDVVEHEGSDERSVLSVPLAEPTLLLVNDLLVAVSALTRAHLAHRVPLDHLARALILLTSTIIFQASFDATVCLVLAQEEHEVSARFCKVLENILIVILLEQDLVTL